MRRRLIDLEAPRVAPIRLIGGATRRSPTYGSIEVRCHSDTALAVQIADGSLPYGYDFLPDQAAEPKHSSWRYVVRRAAALYVLAEYYRFSGDARLREPSRRALLALRAHSLPIGKAPAGATAMALLAACSPSCHTRERRATKASPTCAAPGSPRCSTCAFRGGGLRENPTSIEDSDFYNGEAWFALAVYADVHRDVTGRHSDGIRFCSYPYKSRHWADVRKLLTARLSRPLQVSQ